MASGRLLMLVWTILFVTTQKTDGRMAPVISNPVSLTPTDGYFLTGDSVTLTCAADGSPTPRFTWSLNGTNVGNVNSTSGTYSISSASSSDAGNYVCRASNQWGTAISETAVTLLMFINDFSAPNTILVTVSYGQLARLQCNGRPASVPSSLYSWAQFYNTTGSASAGNLVTEDNRRQVDQLTGDFHFANTLSSDRDSQRTFYGCRAAVSSSSTLITKVGSFNTLTITGSTPTNHAATTAFQNPQNDQVTVLAGQPATFRCFFYGNPTPTITWQKGGQTVSSGLTNYNITYTIDSVQESDDGVQVVCRGTNTATPTASNTFTLNVDIFPMFDANNTGPTDVNATIGDTVSFECNPLARPAATIVWYINGVALNANSLPERYWLSSDSTNLTISNVSVSDFLVVSCLASNTHGSKMAQGSLQVLQPTIVTESPANSTVTAGQTASFQCAATTDQNTYVTFVWFHDSQEVTSNQNGYVYENCDASACTLTINKVGTEHAGLYNCEASNSYSSDLSGDAYLEVLPAPDVLTAGDLWYVFLIIGLLLLLLILLVFCFFYCKDNEGDTYPVDEIEVKNGNNPAKELQDTGFHSFDPPPLPAAQQSVWAVGHPGQSSKFSENGSVAMNYRSDPQPITMVAGPPPPVYSFESNNGYPFNDRNTFVPRSQPTSPMGAGYGFAPVPPTRSRPQTPRSVTGGVDYSAAGPRLAPMPLSTQPWREASIDVEPERDRPHYSDGYFDDPQRTPGLQPNRMAPPPPQMMSAGGYDPNRRFDLDNPYPPYDNFNGPYGGDPYGAGPVDDVFADDGRIPTANPYQYGQANRAPSESSV